METGLMERVLTELVRFEIAASDYARAVAPERTREEAQMAAQRELALQDTLREALLLRNREVARAPVQAAAARLGVNINENEENCMVIAYEATRVLLDLSVERSQRDQGVFSDRSRFFETAMKADAVPSMPAYRVEPAAIAVHAAPVAHVVADRTCICAENLYRNIFAPKATFPCSAYQERNMKMHYNHTKFRISAYVAEFIKMAGFSAATAKLFLALIFLQDQTEKGWPVFEGDEGSQDHFVLVAELRELGFPSKTRSSRFLRKPVADLVAIPGIFDHLEIASNGRYLTWRFSENFFDVMADMDVYGLIDASEIALCHGKFGGALLAQIPLHRKKRRPEFRLLGPQKRYDAQPNHMLPNLVPSQIQRHLRPQLQKWADETKITFAVLLVQEGSRPGYTDVVIRMRHKDTEWPEGRFLKRAISTRIWTVSPKSKTSAEDCAAAPPEGPPFAHSKRVSGLSDFWIG